ncbi:MAG TPA: hypothetical protein VIK53_01395 [Verrucomicrobiae bacterium]
MKTEPNTARKYGTRIINWTANDLLLRVEKATLKEVVKLIY